MTRTVAHCPACRDQLVVGLPMDLEVFLAASKEFNKVHVERCQSIPMMGSAPKRKEAATMKT